MSLIRRLKTVFQSPDRDRPRAVVAVDDEGVTCSRPGGPAESIRWDELHEVVIVTTDEGPFVEDVFFVLSDAGAARCTIADEADGFPALLGRLQALPGFDNRAVIAAMGSADNARFPCWKRAPRPDA